MPLISSSRIISDKKFLVSCAAPLKRNADWLLEFLEKIENERGRGFLEDGTTVQFGWSILTIRREGDLLLVTEPNFAGNPFRETNPDLTWSLFVQGEQNTVLQALGLEIVPVSFQDKIIFSKGTIESSHIYLHRHEVEPGDSGWYIGEVDGPQKELKSIHVYRLLYLRQKLLKVLALPVGYVVVFKDDRIEAILNEHDEPQDLSRLKYGR